MLITIEHIIQTSLEKNYTVDFIATWSTTIVKEYGDLFMFLKTLVSP
jgi:hypothetical protein